MLITAVAVVTLGRIGDLYGRVRIYFQAVGGAMLMANSAAILGYLFAAFLGYNPLQTLLGPKVLAALPAGDAGHLVSPSFFPSLIAGPFHDGVVVVSIFSIVIFLVAAGASWLRGGRYVHDELEADQLEADLLAGETSVGHPGPAAVRVSLSVDPAREDD